VGENPVGAEVTLPCGEERAEEALFGEGGGRVLVEVVVEAMPAVETMAREAGVACSRLGRSGGRELKMVFQDIQTAWPVAGLKNFYENSLPNALR